MLSAVNRADIRYRNGTLLKVFHGQSFGLGDCIIFFLCLAPEMVDLALAEVGTADSCNDLEKLAFFEGFDCLIESDIVHRFREVGLFRTASDVVDVSSHIVKCSVAEITKIDSHHFTVGKDCRHREVNLFEGVNLTGDESSVEIDVRIHNRSRLKTLSDDLKHEGVERDFVFALTSFVELLKLIIKISNIGLIHITNMGNILPRIRCDVGYDFSLNSEILSSCYSHGNISFSVYSFLKSYISSCCFNQVYLLNISFIFYHEI